MGQIQKILTVTEKSIPCRIDYVQGSNAIPILFRIIDFEIPTGAIANIYIKKPSGNQIYNGCSINGQIITVTPTTQMFIEQGRQFGQLQILSDQKILKSFLLIFDVEKNIIDDSAIESTDEFTALEEIMLQATSVITSAQQAATEAEQAAGDADDAAGAANAATSAANTAAQNAQNIADEVEQKLENGDFVGPPGPVGPAGSIENISQQEITFTEAAELENIANGETLAVLFGKLLKMQNNLPDETTIQAAENAGILSVGGLTLLNSILQLYLEHAVVEKTTIDGWIVIKYADGTCEGYKDVMASGTIAALGTSGTLAAVGYMAINAENPPASITTERAWADLVQTDGWGWIARMAGGASSAYRFLTFGSGGATRNIIVRWSFTGTY